MLNVKLALFFLPMVISQRDFYFRSVEDRCIPTCAFIENIPNWSFQCDGDNSTCDWQCAGQRMGCAEGKVYHCAQDFQNYEFKRNKTEYIEACAPERSCNAGEEPFVTFPFDDLVRSPRNALINCVPCTNPRFYNSQVGKSSASYARCYQQKFNKCIPEDNKIDCGIPWRERKDSDGYCRCDARNGYAPENENVKTKCFYSDEFCVFKPCPQLNQELLLNYTCGDRCPSGMHRTEQSDDCVLDKFVQTTKSPPTTLTSQPRLEKTKTHVSILPTTETVKELFTKRKEKVTYDSFSTDPRIPMVIAVATFVVLVFIFVVICACKITKCSEVHITLCSRSKTTIRRNTNNIAGNHVQVTGKKSNVQICSEPTETSPKEIEETSFSNSPDHTFQRNGREIEHQSDSESPLLLGNEENRSPETSGDTTTVTIERRMENDDLNNGPCHSPGGIADVIPLTDEGCELCRCDEQDGLCNENLQLIAQQCGDNMSFRAALELSADLDPVKALQVWRANITSENRYEQFKKLVDAVLATEKRELYSQLKEKLFKDETAVQGPVFEGKIPAKILSSKNNPLPPNSVLRTHSQVTQCPNSIVDDTKETSYTNKNAQVPFCTKGTCSEIVNELRTSPNREQARRKHINSADVNELRQASERETDTEASERESLL
ncbi:uncharacterized protein LOC128214038 [Mya arenaria]|uniref:uncharacterized protein LOC128214038 n=1 Tax=Mya arenaria TaxID=6604 RepID=UPI0022E84690|nr:uncharacterized protein LOC128214038 [Mya arenaria]